MPRKTYDPIGRASVPIWAAGPDDQLDMQMHVSVRCAARTPIFHMCLDSGRGVSTLHVGGLSGDRRGRVGSDRYL